MTTKYTIDTCTAIKVHDNHNIGDMLRMRLDLHKDDLVYITSQSEFELGRNNYILDNVLVALSKTFGCKIVFRLITDDQQTRSKPLEKKHPLLHIGDSAILVFAIDIHSTLISNDKDFLTVAKKCNVKTIDPNLLPCEKVRLASTRYQRAAKHATRNGRPSSLPSSIPPPPLPAAAAADNEQHRSNKVKKVTSKVPTILYTKQKIIWTTFS